MILFLPKYTPGGARPFLLKNQDSNRKMVCRVKPFWKNEIGTVPNLSTDNPANHNPV